jgi:hypothetical protein
MAGIGAGWALMAILTWDLAGQKSSYFAGDRDLLTQPWLTVAALPPR